MTLRTGKRPNAEAADAAAFTLIELILVMALLIVVLGIAFPNLKNFFRGRNLDSEARRLLTLTQYGQSRAVSEGMPMVLWIDAKARSYGLKVQTGYTDQDEKAVEYTLDKDLSIEVETSPRPTMARGQPKAAGVGNVPMIRFMPDGMIGETSPDRVALRQGTERNAETLWIVGNTNRLSYAIYTDNQLLGRRH